MLAKFSGRIYPNGEFGVALIKSLPIEQSDRHPGVYQLDASQRWKSVEMRLAGIEKSLEISRESPPPLDLSILPNSHSLPRARRGSKGITSYGRKLVRNAAFLLERENDRRHLSFLTLTLPSLSIEESIKTGREFSQILRITMQALKRELERHGLPSEIVGCVEIQSQRFDRDRVLSLHLHLVFVGRKRFKSWAVSPDRFRAIWKNAIISRVPELSDRNFASCENVAKVKSSAQNYLGKYLSKGIKELKNLPDELREALPSAWFCCTLRLKRRMQSLILHSFEIGIKLINLIDSNQTDKIIYCYPVEIWTSETSKIAIGYYGRIALTEVDRMRR